MKRVFWIVNQYAVPPSFPGGTRHYEIGKRLCESGMEVHIFASDFDHIKKTRFANRPLEVNGVNFEWVHTKPYSGNGIGRIWSMLSFCISMLFLFRNNTRPDYLFASSPHLFGALFSLIYAKLFQISFCLEIRDIWPQSLIEVAGLSEKNPLIIVLKWIEKFLYSHSDKIVTLLPNSVDHIVANGGNRRDIMVLPNGPSLSAELKPISFDLEPDFFYVLYAGAHGIANALDSIVDLAGLLSVESWADRIRIVFVGDGTEKQRLMDRALSENLKNVLFFDPIPKDSMSFVLSKADLLIASLLDSPLYAKGISLNKIYDYLSSAKPIVFGASAFNNPVSESNAGIVVSPQDAVQMLRAVKQLYFLSPHERNEMGSRGKHFVLENFGFDHKVNLLLAHLGLVSHGF
jgi:hypothetical protein